MRSSNNTAVWTELSYRNFINLQISQKMILLRSTVTFWRRAAK